MVGDGRSSSQTRPTSKWLPITRKIVSAVTFPQRRPTGSTFKVIRFSPQSKRRHPVEMVFINISKEVLVYEEISVRGDCHSCWPGRRELIRGQHAAGDGPEPTLVGSV